MFCSSIAVKHEKAQLLILLDTYLPCFTSYVFFFISSIFARTRNCWNTPIAYMVCLLKASVCFFQKKKTTKKGNVLKKYTVSITFLIILKQFSCKTHTYTFPPNAYYNKIIMKKQGIWQKFCATVRYNKSTNVR